MPYTTEIKRNMGKKVSLIKQAGVSSLLFIVLVGLSLTVLTVGYMSSMRNLQSSATTAHAQTQAQMQAMIGYHALTEYLNKLSKEDNGLQKIDQVCNGEIKKTDEDAQITFERVGTCNNHTIEDQYIFNIIGKSGGASAILQSSFVKDDEKKVSSIGGSIFAGGLLVGKTESLQTLNNEKVTILVGKPNLKNGKDVEAGNIVDNSGNVITDQFKNITVEKYDGGLNIVSAADLRDYANYIFTRNSAGAKVCYTRNLGLDDEDQDDPISCPSGVSYIEDGKTPGWNFNPSIAKLKGVVWFDNDVHILANDSTTVVDNMVRNAVLSTGTVYIQKTESNVKGILNLFSPYSFVHLLDKTSANRTVDLLKTRLRDICPASNFPNQICKNFSQADLDKIVSYDYFENHYTDYMKPVDAFPSYISNILGMGDTGFSVTADNQAITNLYGNLIGSRGAGGTGRASSKFIGRGDINVVGNLVVTHEMDLTEMDGSIKVQLGNSKAAGNVVGVSGNAFTAIGIRYR
ncbi:hypothetical protein [Acinetobacter terrestris]|uniref:hypothetical protein n=1 Tax=Acinetobacter terrestris TaxID=2529843 RepID=UPI00103F4AC6|nr:hypothetical protein [Acinetobacter terrestris]TCB62797.1 hypothetical protein E0H81_11485 [Acinetobacter terrestris]